MNYLLFKNKFPKSCSLFFEWISSQDMKELELEYVDNNFFRIFFYNYFKPYPRWFVINKEKQVNALKNLFPDNFNQTDNDLAFSVNSESDYENLFNCLEILIEKELI